MRNTAWIITVMLTVLAATSVHAQYQSFIYDGLEREYAVVDPNLPTNPDGYPLIVALHGAGAEGASMIGTAFLIQKANAEKFIVAAPSALKHPVLTWWNAGGAYEDITSGTDDLGFINAMIDTMLANYNIDSTRIYLMGHSNGSMMCYRVASELSHRIAAMAVNTGQMVYEHCNPAYPIPLIHFHGLEDPLCPYEGGLKGEVLFQPVDTVMAIWGRINGCSATPDIIFDQDTIIGRKWASGDGNSDVILYTIEGWGHSWPRKGEPGIDATDVMWNFLKTHSRGGGSAGLEEQEFEFDGETRTYLVYTPPEAPGAEGYPLVVGMHCHTGTAQGFLSYTEWLQKARAEKFIGVFPNGLKHAIGTAWNAGNTFEIMTGKTDDIGFISALIDRMVANYDINEDRIYATGHSNGSSMSYRVAAELSDKVAAIGCVAMPMVYQHAAPEYTVPIIHFHGMSDTTCPYEGVIKPSIVIPPVDSCLALWRVFNGCDESPITLPSMPGYTALRWPSTSGKADIVLYTVDALTHGWPTATNDGISATDKIWEFFMANPKSFVSDIEDRPGLPSDIILHQSYPNPFRQSTTITYTLAAPQHVALQIYDQEGREVQTLVNVYQPAGMHQATWKPAGLPSGVYYYRIKTGNATALTGQRHLHTGKLIMQE